MYVDTVGPVIHMPYWEATQVTGSMIQWVRKGRHSVNPRPGYTFTSAVGSFTSPDNRQNGPTAFNVTVSAERDSQCEVNKIA